MSTDRIEKKIVLRAPLKRVWRAVSDSREFGDWFGVKFDVPFTPGAKMRGKLVGSSVDSEVAKMQRQFEDIPFEMTIEEIVPERRLSFRSHPSAVEKDVDYSDEPTTLIVFALKVVPRGVSLTGSESRLASIP